MPCIPIQAPPCLRTSTSQPQPLTTALLMPIAAGAPMLRDASTLLVFAMGMASYYITLSVSVLTSPIVSLVVFFVGLGLGSLMKTPAPTVLPLYDTMRNIPRPYTIVPAYYAYKGNTRPPKRGRSEQATASTAPARNRFPCPPNKYRQVTALVRMSHSGQ